MNLDNFEINPRSDYIFLVGKRPNYYFKAIVLCLPKIVNLIMLFISFLFLYFFYVCAIFYNLISIAYQVDDFEPNQTVMLWCEYFVVPLFLSSSCPVYRSTTEYNS